MTILLSDAPAIPGLRFRGIQRPWDDASIAELVNAAMTANGIPHRLTLAQIASWLDHPTNLDLAADLLFAEVDGRVVAYAEGGWEQDNDGGRNYSIWGEVHPDWRRRGLGPALLRWIEERQHRLAATHPNVEKRLESRASEKEPGRLALLEANGYRIARYDYEMERPRTSTTSSHSRCPMGSSCGRLARRTCGASGRPRSRSSATTGERSTAARRASSASGPIRAGT
jgi:GNAT superfamily N-acetyltransferase